MTTTLSNKENIAAFYAKAARGDVEGAFSMILDLYAPEFVVHEAPVAPWAGDYQGREALLGVYSSVAAFLDPTGLKVLTIVSENDTVVVLLQLPFRASPDEEAVPIPVTEWYTFENGKIVDVRVFYWETPVPGHGSGKDQPVNSLVVAGLEPPVQSRIYAA